MRIIREPNVRLLSKTNNALDVLFMAARRCYSDDDIVKINKNALFEDKVSLIKKIINMGHLSVLEHVNYTFEISGISRVESHQHVRHRIGSYSQQSQRYCNVDDFNVIVPESIHLTPDALNVFTDTIKKIEDGYKKLKEIMISKGYNEKQINEDIRYILPNCMETKFVTTMNIRSLYNFFEQRCCTKAQLEIRKVAKKMLDICKLDLPFVFENCGPKCIRLKRCPEKKSCGYYKVYLAEMN